MLSCTCSVLRTVFMGDDIFELGFVVHDLLVFEVAFRGEVNDQERTVRLETAGEGFGDGVEVGDMMVRLGAL